MNQVHQSETGYAERAPDARAGESRPVARAPSMAAGMWEPAQRQPFDPRRKSPRLAAVLAVIPGVGQLYIGYYMRGIITAAAFVMAVMLGALVGDALLPISIMSSIFIWVFNLIDAGRMAALYNHAAAGSDVIEMPEDFKLPALGGSILGGVALLLFGGIALSNTAFDYSLEWLEDWWPAFPLALGLYLFVRGVMDMLAARAAKRNDA
jgi:TM2 domain-containing membrane protein YozV